MKPTSRVPLIVAVVVALLPVRAAYPACGVDARHSGCKARDLKCTIDFDRLGGAPGTIARPPDGQGCPEDSPCPGLIPPILVSKQFDHRCGVSFSSNGNIPALAVCHIDTPREASSCPNFLIGNGHPASGEGGGLGPNFQPITMHLTKSRMPVPLEVCVTLISVGDAEVTAKAFSGSKVVDSTCASHPGTGNGLRKKDTIRLTGRNIDRVEFAIDKYADPPTNDGFGIDDVRLGTCLRAKCPSAKLFCGKMDDGCGGTILCNRCPHGTICCPGKQVCARRSDCTK